MSVGKNLPYYLAAIALFFLLHFIFRNAGTGALLFLLQPTDILVQVFTGSADIYQPDEGFFHPELNIILGASCSGLNFWLISFVMLACTSFKYFETRVAKLWIVPAVLALTYIATLFVNASRILIAVGVQRVLTPAGIPPHPRIHEAEGVMVYLLYLMLFYYTCNYLLHKTQTHHAQAT